jgi:hypothetical protein
MPGLMRGPSHHVATTLESTLSGFFKAKSNVSHPKSKTQNKATSAVRLQNMSMILV